jgi:hypothetical protein
MEPGIVVDGAVSDVPQNPNGKIRALALDVRGTMVHPYEDEPISGALALVLEAACARGLQIGLITATSLKSLDTLVFRRFIGSSTKVMERLVAYTDTGTLAYRFDAEGNQRPLEDYRTLAFDDEGRAAVLSVIDIATERFGLHGSTLKVKPGQVNFYCGGSWARRREVASHLEALLHRSGHGNVAVMVPSAKDTIDIALCDKARPMADFLRRYALREDAVLIVGDSLQEGAADVQMLQAAPGALAWHVGEMPPVDGASHSSGRGPEGCLEVIQGALS